MRREEALEVRSEGTRLEREMKADRVAKAERVFKYQHECDVAEMEAKPPREESGALKPGFDCGRVDVRGFYELFSRVRKAQQAEAAAA